jgi:hypothetical protein
MPRSARVYFTVTMRSVMERSKIALHKWMIGFYMMCASKKGVSAHQLHRSLGITYEAAWFMAHRIREAMRQGGLAPIEARSRWPRWQARDPLACGARRLGTLIPCAADGKEHGHAHRVRKRLTRSETLHG